LRPDRARLDLAGDPIALVKGPSSSAGDTVDKQMSQELRQHKVIEIVAGRFDSPDMARSFAGLQWKKLSTRPSRSNSYRSYGLHGRRLLDKIDSYSGQKVQFVSQNAIGSDYGRGQVCRAAADSSDQPIQITTWSTDRGGWKVYDVTVDDISITANYR